MQKGKFSKPRSHTQEDLALERTFREVTGGADAPAAPAPGAKKRRIAITAACVAAVLVLCAAAGLWYYLSSTADDGKIYSNVYTAGINLGGMTPAEAEAALADVGAAYTEKDMVITTNFGTLRLSPADTGAWLDITKLVSDAYAYGREGSRTQQAKARADAALTSYTLELTSYLNLDTGYIRAAIEDFAERYSSTLTQSTALVSGEKPELEAIPQDPEKTFQTLTITMGTPGISLDTAALYKAVLDAYHCNSFAGLTANFSVTEPEPLDLTGAYTATYIAPVDAVLDKSDYSVTSEVWGYGFDLKKAQGWMASAKAGASTKIPLTYLPPAVTSGDLEVDMFPDTLATFDSPYNAGNTSRSRNLELSAAAINGTILEPGEVFSFNGIVGERTPEKGYQGAPAYVGGQTVDQVGGGICQVASTIYYCTLLADLEILEREEHMFAATYVPMGMDATINWGTIDFKFRNTTGHPLRIDCWASGGYVHVALMGADTKDYYVDMEYVIDQVYDWKTVEEVMDPDNEYGYEDGDVIQDPYTGYDVRTFKCKYSKATDELLSRDYEATSNFEWRDQVVCKIRVPETEPPTEAPTEAPTDPPETEPPTDANQG